MVSNESFMYLGAVFPVEGVLAVENQYALEQVATMAALHKDQRAGFKWEIPLYLFLGIFPALITLLLFRL
jgi:hypothetical protein